MSSSNAAQCCYLTEQCESNPEILLQEGDCDNDVSVHKDLKRKILDTQEFILLFSAILIALHRGHQIMLNNLFENKALKKHKSKTVKPVEINFRTWSFKIKVERSWCITCVIILFMPLAITLFWLSAVVTRSNIYYSFTSYLNLSTFIEVDRSIPDAAPNVYILALASFVDSYHTYYLAKDVFCVIPCWQSKVRIKSR